MTGFQRATDEQIRRARELYANNSDNDVEIDDNAELSDGCDGGVWVSAWVWVPNPFTEEESE